MSTIQRGSGWSIRLVFFLYRLFGYSFVYYLMYPVTFFYLLVASNVKVALKDYYQKINKPFNMWIYFNHLRHFAICMCDRFISRVAFCDYSYECDDSIEELERILGSGCVLLLSHFGGWAAAGNCFGQYKISIIMQEALLGEIKKIEDEIPSSNSNLTIIDLSRGGIYASMEAISVLLSGEVLAMLADRATKDEYCEQMEFFGSFAGFHNNTFYFSLTTQKPLVAIAFVYQSPQHYKIKYKKIEAGLKDYKDAMREYVLFLEQVVKDDPKQWFNFYRFWKEVR